MNWTPTQQENLLILIRRRGERLALAQQLTSLQKTLDGQRTQQATLQAKWADEQADVDRLERLSWATIYYNLLSRHDEQLAREVGEAQHARLDYDAVTDSVATLTRQADELHHRLLPYADVDEAYEQLLREKEQLIRGERDRVYQEHVAHLTAAEQRLTELNEAKQAGLEANDEADRLIQLLNEAHGLGNWDLFMSSSVLSVMKYSKLDEVRDQAGRVRGSVQRFSLELADIHQQLRSDWLFDDGLTRFVDIFFDNIFTDMAVQQRIGKARSTAQTLLDHIRQVLRTVTGQQADAQVEQAQRTQAVRTYLEQAL